MSDSTFVFLLEDLDVCGAIVSLESSWQAIQTGRNYPPLIRQQLGEVCAVSVLIAASLKQPGRLTFQLSGDGTISMLVVDCSASLNLRGYAKYSDTVGASGTTKDLFGAGKLLMSLETEEYQQPYQSFVPIEGANLTEIFGNYLSQSEQRLTTLILAANDQKAAGILLQKLPAADQKDPDGWNRVSILANTISTDELLSVEPIKLLERIFADETVRAYEAKSIQHSCPPDREKIRSVLQAMGIAEVSELIRTHGEIVVRDDLSNHTYRFDAQEALGIFEPTQITH